MTEVAVKQGLQHESMVGDVDTGANVDERKNHQDESGLLLPSSSSSLSSVNAAVNAAVNANANADANAAVNANADADANADSASADLSGVKQERRLTAEETVWCKRTRSVFDMFDRDHCGAVMKEEIGTIMRELDTFPSEEDLVRDVFPSVLNADDELVRYDRFERFMLDVFARGRYSPDSVQVLIQAFRVLDTDNKGYLDEEELRQLLTTNDWAFRDKEIDNLFAFSRLEGSDDGRFYYIDYIERSTA